MDSNDILFGQVESVFTENIVCAVEKFPDFIFYQVEKNNSLTSNNEWSLSSQTIESPVKFINVLNNTTDFEKYKTSLKSITKKQKIISLPMISAIIYESGDYDGTLPRKVICAPMNSSIMEIPSIGQWIMIMKVELSGKIDLLLNRSITHFYFPFSFNKKVFNINSSIKTINDNKTLSNGRVRQILWPRSGSSIIKNSNGKSNIQVNDSCILLSSGYNDIKSFDNMISTQQKKLYEFTKFNPPMQKTDAFIFVENFDRQLENKMSEYKKLFYESAKFEDQSIIDENISSLSSSINFNQRLKSHFNVDHSGQYEWKFETKKVNENAEVNEDNGIVIASNNIHLVKNTSSQQVNYSVARSEPTIDLIFGLVDIVEKLIGSLETHIHTGSPAAVGPPAPDFISQLPSLKQSVKKIKDGLKDIGSPSIHIS